MDASKVIDSLLYTEYKLERLRESEYNPSRKYSSIADILRKRCELSNAEYYEVSSSCLIFELLETRRLAEGLRLLCV